MGEWGGSVKEQSRSPRLGRRLPSGVPLLSRRVQHLNVVQREAVSDVRHVFLEDGGLVEGQRCLQRLFFFCFFSHSTRLIFHFFVSREGGIPEVF